MRWLMCGLLLAGLGCSRSESPNVVTGTPASQADAATSMELAVVKIEPTTLLETRLGKVRFDAKPPFKATVVEGDTALADLVAEMNALDHVMSAGVMMAPSRVERTSDEFFRIMRYGWLKEQRNVRLRTPSRGAPPRRFDLVTLEGKKNVNLASVEVDDVGYVSVVGGPMDQRVRVGKMLAEVNERESDSVRTAPPPGDGRGSYGRVIERGTPAFFTMMRNRLYREGGLLVPSGRPRPSELTVEGRYGLYVGSNTPKWLSVEVPPALSIAKAPAPGVEIALSGPPGGPLGFRVLSYEGISYDANAVKNYVLKQYGAADGFVPGEISEVEIGGRTMRAMTFQSGRAAAHDAHLVALLPQTHAYSDRDQPADKGLAFELTTSASGSSVPRASDILGQPSLAVAADSVFVDFSLKD